MITEDLLYMMHLKIGGIAWARKSGFKSRGIVACYGGGWTYGSVIYIRVWRFIIAIKIPIMEERRDWTKHKKSKLPFFEWYFPKNYVLNRGVK